MVMLFVLSIFPSCSVPLAGNIFWDTKYHNAQMIQQFATPKLSLNWNLPFTYGVYPIIKISLLPLTALG